MEPSFRVVSLNVCRLGARARRGARGRRVDSLLRRLDADVVALQEVEHGDRADAARDLGGFGYAALGRHSPSGSRGVAVMCRTPILEEH